MEHDIPFADCWEIYLFKANWFQTERICYLFQEIQCEVRFDSDCDASRLVSVLVKKKTVFLQYTTPLSFLMLPPLKLDYTLYLTILMLMKVLFCIKFDNSLGILDLAGQAFKML